jgi:hypothetical protein
MLEKCATFGGRREIASQDVKTRNGDAALVRQDCAAAFRIWIGASVECASGPDRQ